MHVLRPLFYPLSSSSLVFSLSSVNPFLSLSRSLPVLQCDVTIRELIFRILRVLHSSFLTCTAQMKAEADTRVCSLDGVTTTPQHLDSFVQSICALQLCEVCGRLGTGFANISSNNSNPVANSNPSKSLIESYEVYPSTFASFVHIRLAAVPHKHRRS